MSRDLSGVGLNELLAVAIRLGESDMKAALIILAIFSVALAGLAGFMLARADSTGQVALWAIMLVANLFNCVSAGSTLGKMR